MSATGVVEPTADAPDVSRDDPRVDALRAQLRRRDIVRHTGRVVRAVGTSLRVSGLPARVGQRCLVSDAASGKVVHADVVGVDRGDALLVPLGGLRGVAVDSEVTIVADRVAVPVGDALLGRVLDGFGEPLDGGGPLVGARRRGLEGDAPNPLTRRRVDTPFETGVRALDTLLAVGVGQRLGIFAPAGAGKSTLLGMIATHGEADVIVVGLVGERGREVREFLEEALGAASLARAVVVVATSERPAMERISAALTATAVAEGFRAEGRRVLLLLDSVTRYARAVREVGLAIGEPPVRQGFTPSVFAELPRLFERAGNDANGSMTAFYTVLTDDDDGLDPVAEETRSILDGHVVLSRALAEKGQFPAIDVLASISRLAPRLLDARELALAERLRALLAKHREIEFLVQVGEYQAGSDALADEALARRPAILDFLSQPSATGVPREAAWTALAAAVGEAGAAA